MKKQLLKIVSLMCELNETGMVRVAIETFRKIDAIDVHVYPNGGEAVRLSSSDMSLMSIVSYLHNLKYEIQEIAA